MAKLVIIFSDAMSKEDIHLTNYCKLMSDLLTNENVKKCHHGVQLKHFKRDMCDVTEQYLSSVINICTNIEERFSDIKKPAIIENMRPILDNFTGVFIGMLSSKNSVSILRSFSLRTATESRPYCY